MPGRRPIASMYSPKEYAEWQKEAAKHLKAVPADQVPPEPHTGPLWVSIEVQAQRPKTTKLAAPKPDVDNYAKGVLDAITKDGRFWSDDSQVVLLTVLKKWGPTDCYLVSLTFKDL